MILVDTSVWIDHLRAGDDGLIALLNSSQVLMHSYVVGELACGNLRNRSEVLALFKDLPRAVVATDDEVLFFIEQRSLMGRGLAYIDACLLAATTLASQAHLWTRDKRLAAVAHEMGLAHEGSE